MFRFTDIQQSGRSETRKHFRKKRYKQHLRVDAAQEKVVLFPTLTHAAEVSFGKILNPELLPM